MKLASVLLLFAFLAPPVAHYGHVGDVLLPDPARTPGQATEASEDQVCSTTWGDDERHVTPKMKDAVCLAYGLKPHCYGRTTYEIDHLIPRELGGADTMPNLWPQPYNAKIGAHEKDHLENLLHKDVCELHTLSLAKAQSLIASNWYKTYLLSGLWKANDRSGTARPRRDMAGH